MAVSDGLRPIADRANATVAQVATPGCSTSRAWPRRSGSRDGRDIAEDAADLDLGDLVEAVEPLVPMGPAFASDAEVW
jgi:hypothetical protein